MTYLIAGICIFFGIHLFPWFSARRDAAVARLGIMRYKAAFALIAGIGLGLMIYGYATTARTFLWAPPEGARSLAYMLVPLAILLAVSAELKSNIKRLTAHPMLWGIGIWSGVHLLNNGDLESLLLFGSFLVYAPAAMISANLRGAAPRKVKTPVWRDIATIVVGFVLTGLIVHFHEFLFGVAVV